MLTILSCLLRRHIQFVAETRISLLPTGEASRGWRQDGLLLGLEELVEVMALLLLLEVLVCRPFRRWTTDRARSVKSQHECSQSRGGKLYRRADTNALALVSRIRVTSPTRIKVAFQALAVSCNTIHTSNTCRTRTSMSAASTARASNLYRF